MRALRYSPGNVIDAEVVGEPVTRDGDTRLPVKDVEGGKPFYLCFEQTEIALHAFEARKGSVLGLLAIHRDGSINAIDWLVVRCATGGELVRPDAIPLMLLETMRVEDGTIRCEGVTIEDGEIIGISERGLMTAIEYYDAWYGDILLVYDSDNIIGVDYDARTED